MIERMQPMKARLALGGIALIAIVAFGLVPIVTATSPSTPPLAPAASAGPAASGTAPSVAGPARKGAGIRAAILAGTVRAEATVVRRDGTTVLVHYERGSVTAVTPTSITIQGRDGKGAGFTVTAATKVRAQGKAIAYADLKVGDRAMVFGTDQGGTYTAVLIRCVQAAPGS